MAAAHGKPDECERRKEDMLHSTSVYATGAGLNVAPVTDSGNPPSLEMLSEGSLKKRDHPGP